MITRHEYRDGVWVDIEQPTEEEIRNAAHEFGISERIETELLSATPTPITAGEAGAALLILHFPAHGSDDGDISDQEIDFIVGKHFILTVRYEVVAPLHHLKKLLEAQSLVSGRMPFTTDVLLEILFAHVYASVRDHSNHIAQRLAHVEHEMFNGRERDTVRVISGISREFLHIESVLANQEEPFERFLDTLSRHNFFGESFKERTARMLAERTQVLRLITTHRAVATELRETNASLLEVRQNEIVKTLTVINIVVLPLELIAFIFGMHAAGTPLLGNPNAFWIIMAIMLGSVFITILFFARKRWLF